MAAPVRHVHSITDLDADEAAALMHGTQRATAAVESVYSPEGINVGVNIGRAGGGGARPRARARPAPLERRHEFMAAVAESRVLPGASATPTKAARRLARPD